uniref:Uncharacterized protein n=1 Tax=Timema poppense TaxID=170557 RepID=A0A7R9DQX2_TIMPO|nr:unnamed protein product [Timema poppensis]
MKRLMDNRYRYYTYIFVSLWKMIIFFGMTVLTVYAKDSYQPLAVSKMFTNFKSFFSLRHINVTEIRPVLSGTGLPDLNDVTPASGITEMEAWHMAPIWVFVIHSFSAYLCYIFGKFACKIRIQTVSFAFPINLAVPVTVSLLALVCGLRTADPCVFSGVIPDYLFFNSPDIYNLGAFLTSQDVRDINDEFDEIEEDVALDEKHPAKGNTEFMSNTLLSEHVQPMDSITRVYACATMWHETREEMTCMIKSLLRMDVDHAIRKYLQKHLELIDPNYYEFEMLSACHQRVSGESAIKLLFMRARTKHKEILVEQNTIMVAEHACNSAHIQPYSLIARGGLSVHSPTTSQLHSTAHSTSEEVSKNNHRVMYPLYHFIE